MRVISTGHTYTIYPDDLRTYDKLPAQVYNVNFHPMKGFWLESTANIQIKERVYGVHQSKVGKVLNAFRNAQRNLGVILSGQKGIGKSLCAKLMIEAAVLSGYPVILCNSYFSGIADFLGDIEQEVVVVFDEFDKTFSHTKDEGDVQAEMLTLFDGMNQGKKLFIITCNEIYNLNEFLINRPGRFHYHFRFNYPTASEIREYLGDQVKQEYHDQINAVVAFAGRVDLNYDCLRAIATELNTGLSFAEAIQDLNIVNLSGEEYSVSIVCTNGATFKDKEYRLDLFGEDVIHFRLWSEEYDVCINCSFNTANIVYNSTTGMTMVPGDAVTVKFAGSDLDEDDDVKALFNNAKVDYIQLRKKGLKSIHYAV